MMRLRKKMIKKASGSDETYKDEKHRGWLTELEAIALAKENGRKNMTYWEPDFNYRSEPK